MAGLLAAETMTRFSSSTGRCRVLRITAYYVTSSRILGRRLIALPPSFAVYMLQSSLTPVCRVFLYVSSHTILDRCLIALPPWPLAAYCFISDSRLSCVVIQCLVVSLR